MVIGQTIRRLFPIGCLVACGIILSERAGAAERPDISKDLKTGHLAAAQESLTKYLSSSPKDDLARFQLGGVEFFAAIEGLAQDSYRYGLKPNFGMIPFLRTPIKTNPKPDAITYDDARKMIERFVARNRSTEGMQRAEARHEQREVRSYEVEHVHGLWHVDFHECKRKVEKRSRFPTSITLRETDLSIIMAVPSVVTP